MQTELEKKSGSMSEGFFIDTNILLRVFLKEERYEASFALLNAVGNHDVVGYLSSLTIGELVTIFDRRKKFVELERILALIAGVFVIVPVSTEIAILAGHLKASYTTKQSSLSFADSIIAAGSLIYNLPLVTYDREFDKIKEIHKRTPEDFNIFS